MSKKNKGANGPIGFWFLNDHLDKKVVDRQLDEFVKQKFAGVVPHARDGLSIPYLSEAWFDVLAYIVDGCVKRGLQVWFYDENPFPSGTAGGRLINKYPHLAGHTLAFSNISAKPVDGVLNVSLACTTNLLRVYAATIDPQTGTYGKFEDVTSYAGMVGDKWHVEGERDKGYGPVFADDSCEPYWRAWVCHQSWALYLPVKDKLVRCILVVTLNKIAVDNSGWYIDALNPETAIRFIEMTHQATFDKLGEKRFKQFTAVFTDEAKLCPPFPWTESLPHDYLKTYNEDIFKVLPDLAFNIDVHSELTRYRYRRLLGQLWLERFVKPMADWCQQHDVPLTGHFSPEEDPIGQATMTPRWASVTASMHWPGCDQITSKIGVPLSNAYLSLGPKLTSSVAHQYGREHVMAEALGISGDNLTIGRMRKTIDWLFLCGVDKFVLHGQFMSLDGHRKREAPPSIFYQSPYWENMYELSNYIERLAQWRQGGQPKRPIAVLYPTAAFEVSAEVANDYAIEKAQHLGDLVGKMVLSGLDFDIVTDHDLCDVKIEHDGTGNKFKIGEALYETMILPDIELLDEPTYSALVMLKDGGIQIESLAEEVRLIGQKNVNSALGMIHQDISCLVKSLVQKYRSWIKVADDRYVVVASFDKGGAVDRLVWNPDDVCLPVTINNSECKRYITPDNSILRSVQQLNSQEVVIEIEPWQTLILTSSSTDGIEIVPQSNFRDTSEVAWEDGWFIMPQDSNVLILSQWVLDSPTETKHHVQLPAISGQLPWGLDGQIVKLTSEVVIDGLFEEAELWWDRSTFGGTYEININGRKVENIKSASKYDVNDRYAVVGDFLKPGINCVQIQVGPVRLNEPAMLDPLRLCGLFKVIQMGESGRPARINKTEKLTPIAQPEDWTKLGYPHFSGAMSYFGTLRVKKCSGRIFLQALHNQTDPIEVFVNGKSAGVCCWSPFRIEVTERLKIGANKVEIRVKNTSINRIEAKTQISGLLAQMQVRVL